MKKSFVALSARFSPVRKAVLASVTVAAMGFASAASANLLSWGIGGPGALSASQVGNVSNLGYSLNPAGFSTQTWTVNTVASDAGNYTFSWAYTGFHAFYNVTAFLNAADVTQAISSNLVNDGPQNCCSQPSNGFSYAGSFTFAGVQAGDQLDFTMGGHNSDSDNRLIGNLRLTQESNVPEPGSLALVGLALAGFAATRRRRN